MGVWRCGGHRVGGHMGTQGQRGHRERDGGRVGMRGSGGGGKGQQSGCSPPPRQDVAFFDAHRTGQLVARLTADVQEFKSSFKLIISQVGPSTAPHPPLMTPQHPPSPSLCPPPLQGLRSSTQAAGCVLSLYLLSPRLTALLLLVLPVLVGAGTALGSVLRALSRQAQEQVMGLGGGGTCRDPPSRPCGAQRCSATSPCWHRWPKPPGWPTRCWATCALCAPSPWRSSRRGEDGGAAVGSSGSLPPHPTPPFSPPLPPCHHPPPSPQAVLR